MHLAATVPVYTNTKNAIGETQVCDEPVARQNCDLPLSQTDELCLQFGRSPCKTGLMLKLLSVLATQFFRSRRDPLLENLALRQQLAVLRQRRPQPRLAASDRLFWVVLRRLWCGWKQALILAQPEAVVRWHQGGFKVYWTWLSRHRARPGRKRISAKLRELRWYFRFACNTE
jgi:hypothetical protein